MALRFVDGFDHYVPSQVPLKYSTHTITTTGSNSMTTMTGRTPAMPRCSSCGRLYQSDLRSQQTWIIGFGLYLLSNETAELIRFNDEASTTQVSIGVNTDGTIRANRASFSSGTTPCRFRKCSPSPDLELHRSESHDCR